MRAVASDGHSQRMLWRAERWLRQLNALLASTSRMASVSSCWNSESTTCTAASIPEIWPAQSCKEPAASWMSNRVTVKMALAMIRLAVSPIPIGHTPRFLFKAIRRQARKGAIADGSTNFLHRCWAVIAREWHKSLEADLKDVRSLL